MLETGAALGLLPVAMAQSALVRNGVRQARPGPGPLTGETGEVSAQPLRLLVAGDAAAIGGGCDHMDRSLAPRLAYGLALRLRRRVRWQAVGGSGWTLARLDDELRRLGTPEHDLALVTVGMNDVLALTPRAAWRRDLERLRDRLFGAGAGLLAFSGLPAVRDLPGFGWPLSPLLGRRARQLDRVLAEIVARSSLTPERSLLHLPAPRVDAPWRLAADGIHPSASGYAYWAASLVEDLAREVHALPFPAMAAARRADG